MIADSSCYAKISNIGTIDWGNGLLSRGLKPTIAVAYEAFFQDGRKIHEHKKVDLVEPFHKMVLQIK
jgi:hypothetical protein